MLVLEEPSTGYETRIYLWEGQLVEEYTAAESDPAPENAQPVCACTRFEAERSGSLLELTTDQGTTRVALRLSGSGGQVLFEGSFDRYLPGS